LHCRLVATIGGPARLRHAVPNPVDDLPSNWSHFDIQTLSIVQPCSAGGLQFERLPALNNRGRSTMARRSRRKGGKSRTAAVKQSFNQAQKTVSAYARKGGKQVNNAVTSFLSKFDTAQLLDALKKKTGMSGRGNTSRRRRGSARRSVARGRRTSTRTGAARRAAAARAKGAGHKRSRRRR
jgi:hypothetical protein